MTVEIMEVIVVGILLLCVMTLGLIYDLGKQQGRLDCAPEVECVDRYREAVDSLDKWCGHEFPQVRLIAAHLQAVGEGLSMNAGTPCGDEPCTISGLREQLRRKKTEQPKSERGNSGYSPPATSVNSARTTSHATATGTTKQNDSNDLLNPMNPMGLTSPMLHSSAPTHSDCTSRTTDYNSGSDCASSSSDSGSSSSSSDSGSCSSCD